MRRRTGTAPVQYLEGENASTTSAVTDNHKNSTKEPKRFVISTHTTDTDEDTNHATHTNERLAPRDLPGRMIHEQFRFSA